ncbi:MAG: flagellar basal body rod protein [Phycisphaerales bacterium]|nr:flagellar basal body rod protein [Phycisphaerales bacterium]MCB9854864.1 flagellar basal body rod protein [Phycisphaerales bacterium]
MSAILGTALSGLERATLGVQAVAGNIANLNTPGYRSVRVDNGTGKVEYRSGTAVAEAAENELGSSDVDVATELIELKRQQHAYEANAALIEFEDRRLGTLLDLIG